MNLKTYTGRSMAEALAAVKKSLGADAVILHTRTYKHGGIWGIGARTVVEITATQGREYRHALRAKSAARAAGKAAPARSLDAPRSGLALATREQTAGELIKRTYAVAQAAMAQRAAQGTCVNPDAALMTAAKPSPPQPAVHPTPIVPDAAQLAREMQAVKRMVARMMHQGRSPAMPREPAIAGTDPLFDKYLALLEQEVSQELADEVIRKVHKALAGKDLDDEALVRKAIRRELAALIPAGTAARLEPTSDGGPRVLAFVGPTGVGKTTTVAKLAAVFKLKQKKRVGLITLDTYRIAAVDQLKTYANIIGVPLRVVSTPPEVVEALNHYRRQGCDVVLIDTAGRSQRDDSKLEQLESLIRAARPHEVHLVLCASCSQAALLETVERFARVRTDRIVFTKLDEAVGFGVLVNVAHRVDKRLSYLTTGQEVPHDIELGQPDRLAGLLLGEGLK